MRTAWRKRRSSQSMTGSSPRVDDASCQCGLARRMENFVDSFSSLTTPHMNGSIDPASIGLPPTWVVDLTASTHSDVAVDETAARS